MGILQARILEWVAISFSRGSSGTQGSNPHLLLGRWILYHWATRKAPLRYIAMYLVTFAEGTVKGRWGVIWRTVWRSEKVFLRREIYTETWRLSRNFPGAGERWLGEEWGELWELCVTSTRGLESQWPLSQWGWLYRSYSVLRSVWMSLQMWDSWHLTSGEQRWFKLKSYAYDLIPQPNFSINSNFLKPFYSLISSIDESWGKQTQQFFRCWGIR